MWNFFRCAFDKISAYLYENWKSYYSSIMNIREEFTSYSTRHFAKLCKERNEPAVDQELRRLLHLIWDYFNVSDPCRYSLTKTFYQFYRQASNFASSCHKTAFFRDAMFFYRNLHRGFNEVLNFELLSKKEKKANDHIFTPDTY